MVFIRSNLHEMDLMSFCNSQTDFFECILHVFRKNLSSILGRAYNVVKEESFVVSLKNMLAHPFIFTPNREPVAMLLEEPPRSKLRGMF